MHDLHDRSPLLCEYFSNDFASWGAVLSTPSEEQGVEGNCTHILGGSIALNLFEPPHVVSVHVV